MRFLSIYPNLSSPKTTMRNWKVNYNHSVPVPIYQFQHLWTGPHDSRKQPNSIYPTSYSGHICKNADSFIAFILCKGNIKAKSPVCFCTPVTETPIVYKTIIIAQRSNSVCAFVCPQYRPTRCPTLIRNSIAFLCWPPVCLPLSLLDRCGDQQHMCAYSVTEQQTSS